MSKRLTEIDILRGLALVFMIIFHAMIIVELLGIRTFDFRNELLMVFLRVTQWTFLGLVGVSVYLSRRDVWGQLKRGTFIFCMGMIVSLVTWIFYPDEFVIFGILHLIGVSVPVLVLAKKLPFWVNILSCLAFWIIGTIFSRYYMDTIWGLPLGIRPLSFQSFDYFPIFPWMGSTFFGLGIGQFLYGDIGEKIAWRESKLFIFILKLVERLKIFLWMGRHSLLIYLLHVPILYLTFLGLFEIF